MIGPTYTPGPWSISGDEYECNDYRIVIRSADHSCIATVGNGGATSDHPPAAKRWKAESPANAHLIAAAPELYEQVELFVRVIEYNIRVAEKKGDDEGARLQSMTLAFAQAVLARARGETP